MNNVFSLITALLTASQHLYAEEQFNFPPPEFSKPYAFPDVPTPAPRPEWLGFADVGVLAAALALAAYFGLRTRSRRHLVVLTGFAVLYFGFYKKGCVCAVGAVQNVALALGPEQYALPLAVGLFFILPLVCALFWGRSFCSSVCPLGAVQELVLLRPLKVPSWLNSALALLPALYLGLGVLFAAVGSAFIICRYDPFVQVFRFGGGTLMVFVGIAVILLSVVVGRPYCRYACPYGFLLGLLSPFSREKVRITTGDCINCHLCADACPYGAIQPPTPAPQYLPRAAERRRLGLLIALIPVLMIAGGGLVRLASPFLARADYRVRLAAQVWQEEQGKITEPTDETEAFAKRGVPRTDAYVAALDVHRRYATGSWFLGGWLGLVLGLRLVSGSVRRHRSIYQINQSACVVCGRCYNYCPLDHERALSLTDAPQEDQS